MHSESRMRCPQHCAEWKISTVYSSGESLWYSWLEGTRN